MFLAHVYSEEHKIVKWISCFQKNMSINQFQLIDSKIHTFYYIHRYADSDLQFSLHFHNWLLPDVHPLYTTHQRRVDSARVIDFLVAIRDEKYVILRRITPK